MPRLLPAWVLATVLGGLVGSLLSLTLDRFVMTLQITGVERFFLYAGLGGALSGLCLGAAQGFVAQRHIPGIRLGPWALATAVAALAAGLVNALVFLARPGGSIWQVLFFVLPLSGLLKGALLGLAQWPLLRGRVPRAHVWIAWSFLGWLLAAFVVLGLQVLAFSRGDPSVDLSDRILAYSIWTPVVAGVVAGLVTGLALERLRPPAAEGAPTPAPVS